MSQLISRQVLDRLNMKEAMISVSGVQSVAGDLHQLSLADNKVENAKADERRVEILAAYGFENSGPTKPFAFASGIAVIPVHGSLINRFGASWGYVTGYQFIRSQMNAALADPDVEGILFDCNSYGGEAAGCFELSDAIYEARGEKPMVAIIDSNCYSACYAVASAADKVVCTPSGGAGSIGVVAMHMSLEKALEKFGVKVSLIYAGSHKVDGNPFEDLPASVRAGIQRGVDLSRDKFVALVSRNRGIDEKVVRDTEAQCYRADEALEIGLIDEVATPSVAVGALLNELSGSETEEEEQMSTANNAPAATADAPVVAPTAPVASAADAAATARTEERARVGGIVGCEEAKGREALANHFALNTDMSVDQAKAALAVSPKAESAPAAPVAKLNPLDAAMTVTENPNITAGAEPANGDPSAEAKPGSKLLSAYKAATGTELS